jgi:hypothetical protein
MRARLLLRRWITHVLVGTVAATAFAVTFTFSAPKQALPECAPTLAKPQTFVKQTSPSSFQMIVTNAVDGLKGKPAEAVALVGLNEDESPAWTNSDGRYYWYEIGASMLWQLSVPCTGDDTYWANMNVDCRRHGPSGNVDTPCYFDHMYLALHRGSGGLWVNPWGYHKYVRSNATGCDASNTAHTISDNKAARSKVVAHMWFRNPFNEDQLLHETQTREMTSHHVSNGVRVGTGQDLSAGTIPSYTAGPSVC